MGLRWAFYKDPAPTVLETIFMLPARLRTFCRFYFFVLHFSFCLSMLPPEPK
jgi:hypothetical protein